MQRLQYGIGGMSCAACVSHVEKALKNVLSEQDVVSVSLLTNSVSIILKNEIEEKEKEILEARLSSAVHAAGYQLLTKAPAEGTEDRERRKKVIKWIISAAFTLVLMYFSMGHMLSLPLPSCLSGIENALWLAIVQLALTLPVVVLNFRFFRGGIASLLHLSPNMDTLIAIGSGASLIYGVVAIFMIFSEQGNPEVIGSWLHDLYFESAAMILTLVSLGKLLESRAKDRAADAVKSLSGLSSRVATVQRDGKESLVPVEEIAVGDLVLIRTGELLPVDGEVVKGEGSVDESALTGESMPVDKAVGARVSAACVLTSGSLLIRATHVGEDTSLSRLVRLLEDAAASKAPIARIADRVSGIFVPFVMGISLLTFVIWMILSGQPEAAFRSAIAVLVISCPCALGLATPTAITVGIGRGAKFGILFRSAESLEKLCSVKTVLLDKTGTVTEGKPVLSDVYAYGIDPKELLVYAAAVERLSSHPLALAVCSAAEREQLELPDATDFRSTAGIGAQALVRGCSVTVGKPDGAFRARLKALTDREDIGPLEPKETLGGASLTVYEQFDEEQMLRDFSRLETIGKTAVLVSINESPVGVFGIADRIREDSAIAVEALKNDGMRCLMLTGDNERTAAYVAEKVNLDGFRASLLPEDKEREVRLLSKQAPTAMVGDGINDAPALVRADIGIAIGAGTEIAIDSADVVLTGNSLMGVSNAYRLSRATLRIIKQNLFWALFYNAICIPVAAGVFYPLFGWQLSPMLASAAMSFSSVCVVTNALRLRRVSLHAPNPQPNQTCQINQTCQTDQMSQISQISQISQKGDDTMLFGKKAKAETYTIAVEGMMCPRCVAHVTDALKAVSGVSAVEVSLESKTATVTATSPRAKLVEAITKAGYEVVG